MPNQLFFPAKVESIPELTVSELKSVLDSTGMPSVDAIERKDLEERVKSAILDRPVHKYDLVANICHDSPPGQGKDAESDPVQVHMAGFQCITDMRRLVMIHC